MAEKLEKNTESNAVEAKKTVDAPSQSKESKEMIRQGVPMDDNTRLDLYDINKQEDSHQKLGDYISNLSDDKIHEIGRNTIASGDGTHIIDVKGNKILDFPIKDKKSPGKSAIQGTEEA